MKERIYACIDLKSFFASVECVERGLDPMKEKLAVVDSSRGKGAICLAISPAMKALGIKNRCRLYEIPEGTEYIKALPRMNKYIEYSRKVYSVYLDFVSEDDIYAYSIDECFIDLTDYTRMYGKDVKETVKIFMDAVYEMTGIPSSAGIGTNLFLAKVALDVSAKHAKDRMGYLDEELFKNEIWHHRPITDIWNIGRGIASRLEKMGIYDLYGVASYDKKTLYRVFGANAEYLIDHANGREPCTISEIKSYKTKTKSISNSQILFEDYSYEDSITVLKEMVDALVLSMVKNSLAASSIFLTIGYSKDSCPSCNVSKKIPASASSKKICAYFLELYEKNVRNDQKIRKIGIALCGLVDESDSYFDMFSDIEDEERENALQHAMIDIKERYGKNSILRCLSFKKEATGRSRNKLVGGHNGG